MMKRYIFLILAFAPLLLSPASGQKDNPMNAVIRSYEQGYFQEVIQMAQNALLDTSGLSRDEVVYLRTYLAFSLVAMGQEEGAVEVFKQILITKPKLELNPEFVSPKIIEVFKKAQIEYFRISSNSAAGDNLVFEKGRPGKYPALWRSSLWPGWGQSLRGEARKGKFLKWGAAGIIAGAGLASLGTYVSHQRYLDATDPEDIDAKYRTYNRWYRMRNFTFNLTVSFWTYGIVDIIISN